MSVGIFKQQVNFVVSVFFIGSFGLFMTIMALDLARIENPVTGSADTSTVEIGY
jgi:hypothetical protein